VRGYATVDELIDVIENNRVYLRCLYVINKVDTVSLDEVDRLAHLEHSVVISANEKLNLDYLLEKVWEYLNFVRIYTKGEIIIYLCYCTLLTICTTSSSFNRCSLPTFCGLCFTLVPHTNAYLN